MHHSCETGLPYWRIYHQIPEIWRILQAFGYRYFGLAIWRIFGDFFKAFGSKFFGLAKFMTYTFGRICLHIYM